MSFLNSYYEKNLITFTEETHAYTMKDKFGRYRSDWKSVTKIIKDFYDPFDSDNIAEKVSKGKPEKKIALLNEWKNIANIAANVGSRTHYFLEKECCELFNLKKELRTPIFECNERDTRRSDNMIVGGTAFLKKMKERGAIPLNTELILGSPDLGFLGQSDNVWIVENKKKNDFGFIITDYKTNNPEKFKPNKFTKQMKYPFFFLEDTELGKYSVQLALYSRLLRSMLKESNFSRKKIYGAIIVSLTDEGEYKEYRVDENVFRAVNKISF